MPEYGSLFVCLMGMGTVFFGLICLIVLTTIMGKIVGGHAAPAVSAPVPAAAEKAAKAAWGLGLRPQRVQGRVRRESRGQSPLA